MRQTFASCAAGRVGAGRSEVRAASRTFPIRVPAAWPGDRRVLLSIGWLLRPTTQGLSVRGGDSHYRPCGFGVPQGVGDSQRCACLQSLVLYAVTCRTTSTERNLYGTVHGVEAAHSTEDVL